MSDPFVVAVCCGRIRSLAGSDRQPAEWTSAIFKTVAEGPIAAGRKGLEGDEQADKRVHGGPDKAILAYCHEHYSDWCAELDCDYPGFGAFGENLTVSGLSEESVCIGDVFRIGTAECEVSQPRQPCWKLGRRWNRADMPKRVMQSSRGGWYLRVIRDGMIAAGDTLEILRRPHAAWSVARANRAMFARSESADALQELVALPAIAQDWVASLSMD